MDNQQFNKEKLDIKQKRKQSAKDTILLYLHDFAFWLSGILLIFMLLFRVVVVSGPSMNDTLINGDYLLILNSFIAGEPQQGDVVVVGMQSYKNGEPIIKRVIATDGQWGDIDFDAGIVYVNGNPQDEPYTKTPTNLFEGVDFPLMVEEGCVFVMGDNRNESKDSRSVEIGQVDKREILGKAIFHFLPAKDPVTSQFQFNRIGVIS